MWYFVLEVIFLVSLSFLFCLRLYFFSSFFRGFFATLSNGKKSVDVIMLNLLQNEKLFNSQIYDFFFFSSPLSCLSETFLNLFLFAYLIREFLSPMHFSFTCTNRWKIFFAFILPAFTFSFLRNEHFRFPYDFFYIFVTANIISASNSSTFRLHVQLGCVMFCREKSFFGTFRSILFGFWRFTLLTTFPNIFLNNPFLKFSAKYFHVGAAFISSNIQDVWIFFVQTFFLSSFFH